MKNNIKNKAEANMITRFYDLEMLAKGIMLDMREIQDRLETKKLDEKSYKEITNNVEILLEEIICDYWDSERHQLRLIPDPLQDMQDRIQEELEGISTLDEVGELCNKLNEEIQEGSH